MGFTCLHLLNSHLAYRVYLMQYSDHLVQSFAFLVQSGLEGSAPNGLPSQTSYPLFGAEMHYEEKGDEARA